MRWVCLPRRRKMHSVLNSPTCRETMWTILEIQPVLVLYNCLSSRFVSWGLLSCSMHDWSGHHLLCILLHSLVPYPVVGGLAGKGTGHHFPSQPHAIPCPSTPPRKSRLSSHCSISTEKLSSRPNASVFLKIETCVTLCCVFMEGCVV